MAAGALLLEGLSRLLLLDREGRISLGASLSLLAIAALLQTLAAAVLAPARAFMHAKRWQRVLFLALWVGIPAWFSLSPVTTDLTSGVWIREQSYAGVLRWGLLGLATAGAVALASIVFDPSPRFRRTRIAVVLVLGLAAQALHVRLYPGQYELLHLALWVAAALCTACAGSSANAVLFRATPWRLRAGALAWLAIVVLCASRLPLRPRDAATIAYTSDRSAVLFGRVLPRREDDVLFEYLRTLDLKKPLDNAVARPSGALRLPANFNVIFIVVDTLRADALEPTRSQGVSTRFDGHHTPFLNDLIQRSIRFERAYAQGAMTHMSMPPLFRSREPYDQHVERGLSFANLMRSLGRTPWAVVPHYFEKHRKDLPIDDLLVGFETVSLYDKEAQNEQERLVDEMLARSTNQPFFAWIHYYAMHYPGWVGKRLRSRPEMWPENYSRPLRWLDDQIRTLFANLKKRGLAERTVVVFTSDHGEGLRDNGHLMHGSSLSEEGVRAPLFFFIPGQKPREVPQTVGNIDIVPTLNDLLGGHARPEHAGRSLVPLLVNEHAAWSRGYFSIAGKKRITLTQGDHKHLFDRPTNMHFRFDLASDPREDADLFDPENPEHLTTLHQIVDAVPTWFATKDAKDWKPVFARRLREVDPKRPPRALPTLLKLIHEAPSAGNLAMVFRWFEQAEDDHVRVLILRELFRKDPRHFAKLLALQLAPIAGTPRAQAFVSELQGYPAAQLAAQRALRHAADSMAPAK